MTYAFLTLPISLPGAEHAGPDGGLIGSNPDKIVDCKITPGHVSFYHPGYSFGTFIYFTTGQAICTTLTVEEYEKRVDAYWQELSKRAAAPPGKIITPKSKFHA